MVDLKTARKADRGQVIRKEIHFNNYACEIGCGSLVNLFLAVTDGVFGSLEKAMRTPSKTEKGYSTNLSTPSLETLRM